MTQTLVRLYHKTAALKKPQVASLRAQQLPTSEIRAKILAREIIVLKKTQNPGIFQASRSDKRTTTALQIIFTVAEATSLFRIISRSTLQSTSNRLRLKVVVQIKVIGTQGLTAWTLHMTQLTFQSSVSLGCKTKNLS